MLLCLLQVEVPGCWEGISTINNFSYGDDNQVTVWKAFDAGPGKSVPWSRLQGQPNIHYLVVHREGCHVMMLTNGIYPFFFFQYRVSYLVCRTCSNCHLETLSHAGKRNRRQKRQNPRLAARGSMKRLLKTVAFSVAHWMAA